ncbi:transposase [Streptosporangium sp. NPDC004631]
MRIVAIDQAACYRTAIRQALPHAVLVVDHFHLVALTNQALTAVRQRVTRTERGRRGGPPIRDWPAGSAGQGFPIRDRTGPSDTQRTSSASAASRTSRRGATPSSCH